MTMKRAAAALAAISLLSVAACATPSRPDMMALPATAGLTAASGDLGYRSVTTVNVSGGEATNPLWTAEVSNDDLKTALEQSLEAAGYMGSNGPAMVVTANMIEL